MWIYFLLGAIVLFNIARCGADLADEAINKASSTVEEKANQSVNFGSLRKVYQKEFEEANSTKISGDNLSKDKFHHFSYKLILLRLYF